MLVSISSSLIDRLSKTSSRIFLSLAYVGRSKTPNSEVRPHLSAGDSSLRWNRGTVSRERTLL